MDNTRLFRVFARVRLLRRLAESLLGVERRHSQSFEIEVVIAVAVLFVETSGWPAN